MTAAGAAGPRGAGPSQQGRGVLIAVVTGEAGARIQAWREREDAEQARRYPPHATLCYDVPHLDPGALEAQVRHAFSQPVTVRLGGVRVFDNPGCTAYVEVLDAAELDEARLRLYDGRHAALPPAGGWQWHVTCLRRSAGSADALERARSTLALDLPWLIDRIEYRVLRGDRYEVLASYAPPVAAQLAGRTRTSLTPQAPWRPPL